MAQQALRRHDNQRTSIGAVEHRCLPPEQMEVLCRGGAVCDAYIVACRELQKPLDTGVGMLGPLTFVAMGQKQDQAGTLPPFGMAGDDELVDDHLRRVRKVAEL